MDTSKYEEYGGGVGFGVAIFWELCADKLPMDAFDPRNVVTMFTGPLSGTVVPAGSRTEMGGIGPQPYPIGWYTRGNMGGRFASQMKYAGWDGIVIEGKADKPVWINIVNDKVTFNDATRCGARTPGPPRKESGRKCSAQPTPGTGGRSAAVLPRKHRRWPASGLSARPCAATSA